MERLLITVKKLYPGGINDIGKRGEDAVNTRTRQEVDVSRVFVWFFATLWAGIIFNAVRGEASLAIEIAAAILLFVCFAGFLIAFAVMAIRADDKPQ